MTTKVQQLAARWVLGLIPGTELSAIATQALVDGYDGRALRELAGSSETTLRDVAPLFERMLEELEAPHLGRKEAALILARGYAAQILDGSLSPYEGAKAISVKLACEFRRDDHTLDPFIYWADEFEDADDLQRRAFCEAAILTSARELTNH